MTSLIIVIHALPSGISFSDALHLAGAAGRLNIVDLASRFERPLQPLERADRRRFLALAYFGCDQSQVQRYLTGKSIAQSRLSLLFNAVVKIPMQLFILFIGAMVFVLSLFRAFADDFRAGRSRSSGADGIVEACRGGLPARIRAAPEGGIRSRGMQRATPGRRPVAPFRAFGRRSVPLRKAANKRSRLWSACTVARDSTTRTTSS